MKNWTTSNTHVGMFVIPEGINVFGNPHQAKVMASRICCFNHGGGYVTFGTMPVVDFANFFNCESFEALVEEMNKADMRLMTRDEVTALINYSDLKNFNF